MPPRAFDSERQVVTVFGSAFGQQLRMVYEPALVAWSDVAGIAQIDVSFAGEKGT